MSAVQILRVQYYTLRKSEVGFTDYGCSTSLHMVVIQPTNPQVYDVRISKLFGCFLALVT